MTPPMASDASALAALEAPPDGDDIFGPSRSFAPRSNRPKPSMISPKLRAKEERKKVIQICLEKLEKIKDPDRNLRRSVCISNTYFKLQDEVKREKQMKHMRFDENDVRIQQQQQPRSNSRPPPLPLHDKPTDKNREKQQQQPRPNAEQKQRMLDKALESIDDELSAIDASMPSLDQDTLPDDMGIVSPLRNGQEDVLGTLVSSQVAAPSPLLSLDMYGKGARKRSFDDVADCDVHEVLSQLYMPPTPRLMSAMDDDDDDDVEVDAKSRKAPKLSNCRSTLDLNQNDVAAHHRPPSPKRYRYDHFDYSVESTLMDLNEAILKKRSEFEIILDALRLDDTAARQDACCERDELAYFDAGVVPKPADSCGQAAILGDHQQSAGGGFHGLLASLET